MGATPSQHAHLGRRSSAPGGALPGGARRPVAAAQNENGRLRTTPRPNSRPSSQARGTADVPPRDRCSSSRRRTNPPAPLTSTALAQLTLTPPVPDSYVSIEDLQQSSFDHSTT